MKLRIAVLAFSMMMGASQATLANDAVGVWITDDGKAKVRLSECATGLCSEIVWLREPNDENGRPLRDGYNPDPRLRNRPILGLEVLQGLRQTGPNQWDGQIYNPENGKLYIAHMTVGGDTLYLKGCVSWGWPCGEKTWRRVQDRSSHGLRNARARVETPRQARASEPAPVAQPKAVMSASAAAMPQPSAPRQPVAPTQVANAAPRQPVVTSSVSSDRYGGDDYLVQVAARQSERDARAAFVELQRRYPDLLGSYKPSIQMADLGTKGIWYRVRVGPMVQWDDAAALCDRIKMAGGDCIVRRVD